MIRKVRRSLAALGVTIALALVLPPSLALTEPASPHIEDQTGDANGLGEAGLDEDPVTDPASVDAVDIQAVSFETRYTTTKVRDEAGNIRWVLYEPDALRVSLKTVGEKRLDELDFLGQQLLFGIYGSGDGGCKFLLVVKFAFDGAPRDLRAVRSGGGCSGLASWSSPTPSSDVALEGPVAALTIPLLSFTTFRDGESLVPRISGEDDRSVLAVLGRTMDVARGGEVYVVGSDVPADVDCLDEPEHPDCEE